MNSKIQWCDQCIILGGGSGTHLDQIDPNKLFGVVEFHWISHPHIRLANNFEIIQEWRQYIENHPHIRWGIFPFRSVWQDCAIQYSKALRILNGPVPDSKFFSQLSAELFI